MYTPLNPTFLLKITGVHRGIPIFLIFVPKHRLWVGKVYPQSMFLAKVKKKYQIISSENSLILQLENISILHVYGRVFEMYCTVPT